MSDSISNIENKLNKEINSFLKQYPLMKDHTGQSKSVTYDKFLSNKMLIIAAIRTGIPYSLFDLIKKLTPFTENEWAEYLNISFNSLQRYKSSVKYNFKPIHSEKIIEIAEVTKLGMDIFGSMEKLKLWLNTPNFALGNLNPFELLKDSYGKELVMSELIRIDNGILV